MFFISCSSTKSCIDPSGKANLCTFFILFLQKAARVLSPPLWICIFVVPKKILSSFLGSTSKLKSSAWGHLTWNFTVWRKSMAKRRITPYQHSSNPRVNYRFQPGGGMLVDFYSISLKWRRMLYISASSGKVCFIVNGYFVAFRDLMLLESRQAFFPVWKPFRNKADFLTSGSWKIWFCTLLHANETQHRLALLIIV